MRHGQFGTYEFTPQSYKNLRCETFHCIHRFKTTITSAQIKLELMSLLPSTIAKLFTGFIDSKLLSLLVKLYVLLICVMSLVHNVLSILMKLYRSSIQNTMSYNFCDGSGSSSAFYAINSKHNFCDGSNLALCPIDPS